VVLFICTYFVGGGLPIPTTGVTLSTLPTLWANANASRLRKLAKLSETIGNSEAKRNGYKLKLGNIKEKRTYLIQKSQ
jgi:hypothetical protein